MSTAMLLRLTNAGLIPKHTVTYRVRSGRFEYLHATKGWRGRSLGSLRKLGVI